MLLTTRVSPIFLIALVQFLTLAPGALLDGYGDEIDSEFDDDFEDCTTVDVDSIPPNYFRKNGVDFLHDPARKWETIDVFLCFGNPEIKDRLLPLIEDAITFVQKLLPCVTWTVIKIYDDGTFITDAETPSLAFHVGKPKEIGKLDRCFAKMTGKPPSENLSVIHLDEICWRSRIILHEIFHVLGLTHEHNSANRDDYITILWENIKPGRRRQYDKVGAPEYGSFGIPYNFYSIMHYKEFHASASIDPSSRPTWALKQSSNYSTYMRENPEVMETDARKLQIMYGCGSMSCTGDMCELDQ